MFGPASIWHKHKLDWRGAGNFTSRCYLHFTVHITVAGQTAPGDGLCLKNHALVIAADHVIVRHIRCRPGDNTKAESDSLSVSSEQSSPIQAPAVKTDDAMTAYERVLAEAGALLAKRDVVDTRIVREVRNGTGKIIDDEEQVGGWPELKSAEPPEDSDKDGMTDAGEKQHGFDPDDPADGNADTDADGYTNPEEYLNNIKP